MFQELAKRLDAQDMDALEYLERMRPYLIKRGHENYFVELNAFLSNYDFENAQMKLLSLAKLLNLSLLEEKADGKGT